MSYDSSEDGLEAEDSARTSLIRRHKNQETITVPVAMIGISKGFDTLRMES